MRGLQDFLMRLSTAPRAVGIIAILAAILVEGNGSDGGQGEIDEKCRLVFASPREGQTIRRDLESFPLAILLKGSSCEIREVKVGVDSGSFVDLEHSGGLARGELLSMLPGGYGEGTDGTLHTLYAYASGLESSIEFAIGPPRPRVSITKPIAGSSTPDDPIAVYLSFADFDIPKDGHAVVSLDGSEITTLSSAHQNSAELSNLPTGLHSLRVDLVPIGSANRPKVPTVLHSEIIFTVVRPTVTLHSAHALPEGVVVVKVTVQDLASLQLHERDQPLVLRVTLTAEGSGTELWSIDQDIWRDDHHVFHANVRGAAGAGVTARIYDIANEGGDVLYGSFGDSECIGPAGETRLQSGDECRDSEGALRLLASASGVADDASRHQEGEGDLGRECAHVFISAGAHDGGDLIDMLIVGLGADGAEGRWERDPAFAWYKNLTMMLDPRVRPGDFCMVAIEANPYMTPRLEAAAKKARGRCKGVDVRSGTAAWVSEGEISLMLDSVYNTSGLSSSLMEGHPHAGGAGGKVVVKSLSMGALTRDARRRVGKEGIVVVKMDIEGAEYDILRSMIVDESLCGSVDFLFVEWHQMVFDGEVEGGPPGDFERLLGWLVGAEGCRTKIFGSTW